jgi:hypothetical protein
MLVRMLISSRAVEADVPDIRSGRKRCSGLALDECPHAAAKAGSEAARGERTQAAGRGCQRNGLGHLVPQQGARLIL